MLFCRREGTKSIAVPPAGIETRPKPPQGVSRTGVLQGRVRNGLDLSWAVISLSEHPVSPGSASLSSSASSVGALIPTLCTSKSSQAKGGRTAPPKEALGPPAWRCPGPHRLILRDTHTPIPMPCLYCRERSVGHRHTNSCAAHESQPTQRSL